MIIKNMKYILIFSLILFSCNLNTNKVNNTSNKIESGTTKINQINPNELINSNKNNVDNTVNKIGLETTNTNSSNTTENITILNSIGDSKSLKLEQSNFLIIKDFKLFNKNKGLILLEQGDLLLLSDDKIEKIDQLERSNLGSICLDSKGNGLIFYVSGNEYDELKNKFYMAKLENYKVVQKNVLFDEKIYPNQIPNCSIDSNGNGLLVYPNHYIKNISKYKVTDKIMDIGRGFYISNNQNIIKLDTQDYINYKLQNIDINSKLVTKEIQLTNSNFKNFIVNQDTRYPLSFLLQNDEKKLELVIVKDINNIKRTTLNGVYDNNIDSFQINEDGNGVIVYTIGEDRAKISVVKVKNFSLDLSSKSEYDSLERSSSLRNFLVSPFSYTSLIDNEGYIFWNRIDNEKNVFIDFLKVKI